MKQACCRGDHRSPETTKRTRNARPYCGYMEVHMKKKYLIYAVGILLILAAIFNILFLYVWGGAFIDGSLEMFPTEEEIEQERIGYGVLFIIHFIIEAVIVFFIYKVFRKKT